MRLGRHPMRSSVISSRTRATGTVSGCHWQRQAATASVSAADIAVAIDFAFMSFYRPESLQWGRCRLFRNQQCLTPHTATIKSLLRTHVVKSATVLESLAYAERTKRRFSATMWTHGDKVLTAVGVVASRRRMWHTPIRKPSSLGSGKWTRHVLLECWTAAPEMSE